MTARRDRFLDPDQVENYQPSVVTSASARQAWPHPPAIAVIPARESGPAPVPASGPATGPCTWLRRVVKWLHDLNRKNREVGVVHDRRGRAGDPLRACALRRRVRPLSRQGRSSGTRPRPSRQHVLLHPVRRVDVNGWYTRSAASHVSAPRGPPAAGRELPVGRSCSMLSLMIVAPVPRPQRGKLVRTRDARLHRFSRPRWASHAPLVSVPVQASRSTADGRRSNLPPVRAALGNHDLRGCSSPLCRCISEWGLWPGLLVYAYETSGTTVAVCAAGLFCRCAGSRRSPARRPTVRVPNRVLRPSTQSGVTRRALRSRPNATPLLVVIVPAASALTARPTSGPLRWWFPRGRVTRELPLQTCSPDLQQRSVLIGPLIAGVLIAVDGPPLVVAVCAGLALLGVAVTLRLIRLTRHVTGPAAAQRCSRTRALIQGIRTLVTQGRTPAVDRARRPVRAHGALDLIFVVLATEEFGLSSSGPPMLAAASGWGPLRWRSLDVLVGRKRLAPLLDAVIAVDVRLVGASRGGVTSLAVALLRCGCRTWRGDPRHRRSNADASRRAPGRTGVDLRHDGTLALVPAQLAPFSPSDDRRLRVRAADRRRGRGTGRTAAHDHQAVASSSTHRPTRGGRHPAAPRIPGVFRPAARPGAGGRRQSRASGARSRRRTVVRKGDPGDSYFAVVSGDVDITVEDRRIRTLTRGHGFGEIALLADVPRTATVTASTDVELLQIERPAFLTAVTGHDASRQAAWGVARTWHPLLGPSEPRRTHRRTGSGCRGA